MATAIWLNSGMMIVCTGL